MAMATAATSALRRSVLFVPGRERMLAKAAAGLGADVLLLDLEDAVRPEDKDSARSAVQQALIEAEGDWGGAEVVVRVNGLDTMWGPRDLAALADLPAVQGIMLPKASSVEDVRSFREAMTRAGAVDGLPMWCLIETPRGVLNASAIAEVGAESFGVTALGVGTNDLTKELGCAALQGRAPLLTALSTVVMAARAFGLSVVDGVYNDTSNAAGFAAEALQARQLGFDGKCLIHPGTVQACNAAFSPSDEEVAWAKAVVEAWQGQDHGGVVTVQGALVEALHVAQAEATLLRASAR